MKEAYGPLAEWFEYLNDDCDYASWSQYFIDGLSSLGAGLCGLELGCGSGAFCRASHAGGIPHGGRGSLRRHAHQGGAARPGRGAPHPVLSGGRLRAESPEAVRLHPLAQRLLQLHPAKEAVPPPFPASQRRSKRAASFGWMSVSAYKLRHKVADNISADDREDVTYLSFNSLAKDQGRDGRHAVRQTKRRRVRPL